MIFWGKPDLHHSCLVSVDLGTWLPAHRLLGVVICRRFSNFREKILDVYHSIYEPGDLVSTTMLALMHLCTYIYANSLFSDGIGLHFDNISQTPRTSGFRIIGVVQYSL